MKRTFLVASLFVALVTVAGLAAETGGKGQGQPDHFTSMNEAFKVLRADLEKLQQAVPPSKLDAFLKAHAEHLQKALDLRSDKMKNYPDAGAAGCPHMGTMAEAFKANEADLKMLFAKRSGPDQNEFLRAHTANLKKLVDTRAECLKTCHAEPGEKAPAKG